MHGSNITEKKFRFKDTTSIPNLKELISAPC